MKIRITESIPVQNPPEIDTVHEVVKVENEPPRYRRVKLYFINCDGVEIGIYPRECEVIKESEEE